MNFELPDIVQRILGSEQLQYKGRFTTGNSGALVIHVVDSQGTEYVVKVAIDEQSENELHANIAGYNAIKRYGLEKILPDFIKMASLYNTTYLVTSYLGVDFATLVQLTENPVIPHTELIAALVDLYYRTIRRDNHTTVFLKMVKRRLISNFFDYIVPAGIISEEEAKAVVRLQIQDFITKKSCFAVFDFTPEDIFLVNRGLKYPDPKQEIGGNPIIDLACFAGVSRDILNLPGSEKGYELLKEFSIKEVGSLLDLDQTAGRRIFCLGRALQFSLSSRFRIETEIKKAREYARLSIHYLQQI